MKEERIHLPDNKKIYFASDFHLGVPTHDISLARERKIVAWLESIKEDAFAIYLLGDIFDFWFEYRHAIPKGFIRLQGKLAELRDSGVLIYFFTGNHDMWMFDYFTAELGIPIYREPILLKTDNHLMVVGHGDGLGQGETSYKILKAFFGSGICQWLFARIHPNLGMGIAKFWSKRSRISNMKNSEKFQGNDREYLMAWCREQEKILHRDYYIFGHRHLTLDLEVAQGSRYLNLGEWVHDSNFAEYNGEKVVLKNFQS